MATIIWDGTDGDNDWTAAGNFVGGVAPANADGIICPPMENASTTDVNGVDDSSVLLVDFVIMKGSYINIGSTGITITYLQIDSDAVDIDSGGIVCLDVDNCGGAIVVHDCASDSTAGEYGLYLMGTAIDEIHIESTCSGDVSLAAEADGAMLVDAITINGGNVDIGNGVEKKATGAIVTVDVGGGVVTSRSAVATLTVTGGTYTQVEGAVAALNVDGGTVYWNTIATATTITVKSEGVLDFSQDGAAKTVTNPIEVFAGATIIDPDGVVASLVLDCNGCTIDEINLTSPPNTRWTRAAVA